VSSRLTVAAAFLLVLAPAARAQITPDCTPLGIFAQQTYVAISQFQRHVSVADLNGDHLPDLVISTPFSVDIQLCTGVVGGIPAYHEAFLRTGLNDPGGVAIGDFDGDGVNDLAVSQDAGSGGVTILRGLASGGVGTGQFIDLGFLDTGSTWDVATADLNGDGVLDLVVSTRNGNVYSYLGNVVAGHGDGTFSLAGTTPTGLSCKGIVLADLDHDGILDAVVAGESASVAVLHGNGSGGVGTGVFSMAYVLPGSGTTFEVTVGDFNHDGIPDIASANYTGQTISVFLGQPGFTFRSAITHTATGSPLGIVAGDFDGDGLDDLVVAASGSAASFIEFRNEGGASPQPDGFSDFTAFGPSRTTYDIAVADLNGDGTPDVLAPSAAQNMLLVALNSCPGSALRVLHTSVTGSGSIVRDPDLPAYDPGVVVQLTAVPDPGWVFSHWAGDASGTVNPTTVKMDFSRTVVAIFLAQQQTLTLSTTGPGRGAIVRSPAQPTYDIGSTVQLTAVPDFGSVFTGWSGDVTGAVNPVDLVMSGDKSVTATFDIDHTLAPSILSVTDVPLDQGGKVKLRWSASSLETTSTNPDRVVTQYFIWREIPQTAFRAAAAAGAVPCLRTSTAAREYFWEFVTALPASRFTGYSYTAGTTNDSTEHGNPYTAFLVQARNAAATRWFDSEPDSGYSVDNLSPTTPGPVVASYGTTSNALHWGPSRAPDLRGYRIHGGPRRDFVPSAANLIAEVADTVFVDPVPKPRYYRIAAVDIHGNLSHYVLVSPEIPVATLVSVVSAQGASDRISLVWYLSQSALPATVYRRTEATSWSEVERAYADGSGFLRYEDHAVSRGERYSYRLGIQDGGLEAFFGETTVLADELEFALQGMVPNPSTGERLTVNFSLPSPERATLELLDVTGRRLAGQRIEGVVGRQTVVLDTGRRLAPGLYWIRLRHAGQEKTTRAVVMP
jgi:hypothetical protein